MTPNLARFVLLVAALLAGCADDSSRLAGGTGSDLPRPTARLFDTAFQPIEAKLYRLWRYRGDSLVPTYQVATADGFVLPTEGSWIVEAWDDSASVGLVAGLPTVEAPTTSCLRTMARWITGSDGIGIPSCQELIDTTNQRRPLSMMRDRTPRPLAAGMFVATDTVHRYMQVPDDVKAFRFLVWKVLWETTKGPDTGVDVTTQEVDSVLLLFHGSIVSPRANMVDVTLPHGDWILEGWTATLSDSEMVDWQAQPAAKWADSAIVRDCLENNLNDCGRPSRAPWVDSKAPDKIFPYRSP